MNRRLVAAIGALAVAVALSSCGGGSTTLTVNVELSSFKDASDFDGASITYCPRDESLEEFLGAPKRLKMRVVDKEGEVLATSFSDPSPQEEETGLAGCTLTITFEEVPNADFYTIEADIDESNFGGAKTASITYSRDELVNMNWVADLVITEG